MCWQGAERRSSTLQESSLGAPLRIHGWSRRQKRTAFTTRWRDDGLATLSSNFVSRREVHRWQATTLHGERPVGEWARQADALPPYLHMPSDMRETETAQMRARHMERAASSVCGTAVATASTAAPSKAAGSAGRGHLRDPRRKHQRHLIRVLVPLLQKPLQSRRRRCLLLSDGQKHLMVCARPWRRSQTRKRTGTCHQGRNQFTGYRWGVASTIAMT